jgi:hypothetical protein
LEIARGIADYFPVNEILFVLTSGVFIVISFPFDVFKFFVDSPSVKFLLWNGIPIPEMPEISMYFLPFGNLHYLKLDNFAAGLALIIFLSLLVGAFIYCSMGVLEWANRRISWLYRYLYKKRSGVERDHRKKDWISINDQMDFHRWLKKNHLQREVAYLASMRQIIAGFLYGSQILFVVTLVSGIFMRNNIEFWLGWTIIITVIALFISFIYESHESRYWINMNSFVNLYRDDSNSVYY